MRQVDVQIFFIRLMPRTFNDFVKSAEKAVKCHCDLKICRYFSVSIDFDGILTETNKLLEKILNKNCIESPSLTLANLRSTSPKKFQITNH